jgi:hypothetical protein
LKPKRQVVLRVEARRNIALKNKPCVESRPV